VISLFTHIKKNNIVFGIACVAVATLGLSFKAILIKLLYQAAPEIDAITILALRFLMALPFFFILLKFFSPARSSNEFRVENLYSVFILGAVGFYLSALLDFSSLAYIPASLERLILFLYPTFVVILSYLLKMQEFSRRTIIALCISYCGIALVFQEQAIVFDADTIKGVLLVFSAAIVFAAYTVGSVKPIKQLGAIRFTAYAMMAATVVTLAHAFSVHGLMIFDQEIKIYLLILIMAIFSTVVPLILIAEGVRRIGASKSSIVSMSGPVVTLYFAYLILGEVIGLMQVVGAVLIIVGISFVSKRN